MFAYRLDKGVRKWGAKDDSWLELLEELIDQLKNDECLNGKMGHNVTELKQKVIF